MADTEDPAQGAPAVPPARLRRVVGWVSSWPLRTRLVVITALLLAIGLGATGGATQLFVSRYLEQQIDDQLVRVADNPRAIPRTLLTSPASPGDYFIVFQWETGDTQTGAWQPTVDLYGTPRLPALTPEEVTARDDQPFTVAADGGNRPTRWRVIAANVYGIDRGTGERYDGIMFVSLPMADALEAARILRFTLAGAAVGIVVIGAVAARLLVRRSLRSLARIETTATAIAAGDYSQRIPERPLRTEVGRLAASLNAMLAQIEGAFAERAETEARMRRFVSDASHELRTPLATIRGYGELYRMGAVDSKAKVDDTMLRVEDAARRMGLLVNDLLLLARIDEGSPMSRSRVDLAVMADDAARDIVALDPARTVRVVGLRSFAPPASLVVLGDRDRLRQVLTNLVGNVVRYTPAGSPVELALGTDEAGPQARVVIEVRDHGPGLPPEKVERIFERFYRADPSRGRDRGGSGLGLAIVAAIVGAHGGHVSAVQPATGGLVVRVELPLPPENPEPTD